MQYACLVFHHICSLFRCTTLSSGVKLQIPIVLLFVISFEFFSYLSDEIFKHPSVKYASFFILNANDLYVYARVDPMPLLVLLSGLASTCTVLKL